MRGEPARGGALPSAPIAEDAARGSLPPLEKGARVWDSKARSEATVVGVFYDDDPPYYAVRVARTGAERHTVRSKLWTRDERAALAARGAARAGGGAIDARGESAEAARLGALWERWRVRGGGGDADGGGGADDADGGGDPPWERVAARVTTVRGDLCRPRLGVPRRAWARLRRGGGGAAAGRRRQPAVARVVHCGANVNNWLPYAGLRAANVDATRELLAFCGARDDGGGGGGGASARAGGFARVPFHYVSTSSFEPAHGGAVLREDDDVDATKLKCGAAGERERE